MDLGRYTKPALIGGVVTGAMSALPLVNIGNCLCCMYVWVGSILSAYLLFKDYAGGSLGDGALVGLFSGICGAVVNTLIGVPVGFMTRGMFGQLDPTEFMPPEALESIPAPVLDMMSGGSAQFMLATMAIGFVVNLALFALIGTLGGLIGAAIFRKKDQSADAAM